MPTVKQPEMPSDVSQDVSWFDRFASAASLVASQATFFAFCVLLVIIWLPSYVLIQDLDLWQLIINTVTTIVTFLMVALLQNSQTRNDQATQHKLNAIADGLADLMAHLAHGGDRDMDQDLRELRSRTRGPGEHRAQRGGGLNRPGDRQCLLNQPDRSVTHGTFGPHPVESSSGSTPQDAAPRAYKVIECSLPPRSRHARA